MKKTNKYLVLTLIIDMKEYTIKLNRNHTILLERLHAKQRFLTLEMNVCLDEELKNTTRMTLTMKL